MALRLNMASVEHILQDRDDLKKLTTGYAYFYSLGMRTTEIAQAQGVEVKQVEKV
ncbi:hypothetical protein HYV64_05670 [Candidatus Shapirobacteria bacterium]|nr:hypothetical protein [Candidatus Shapirobacteria bacterium]